MWLKIHRVSPYIFRGSGSMLTKLFPDDVLRVRGDKICISFGRPAPWNLEGRNIRPKFSAIFDNFQLWSLISPERTNVSQIRKVLDQLHPFQVGWQKFGELWSTNNRVIGAHIDPPKRTFFGRLHFGPWGCCPLKFFTHLTDWPTLASAHHNCDGAPSKNLIVKI